MLLRRLGFLLPLLLPLALWRGYQLGGFWNFLVVGEVFGVLPLLDYLSGVDTRTVAPRGATPPGWRRYFDGLLFAWVPIQLAVLVLGAVVFPGIEGAAGRIGFILSAGILTGGVGIVVAHELGHRLGLKERFFACALLASVGYMHFYLEHNRGHHARVATDADPASARAGESFWRFLPRTAIGSFTSAWQLEAGRLRAAARRVVDPGNRMLWSIAATLAAALGAAALGGLPSLGFFVAQAVVAITLLELVNYLEHYGLRRRLTADGRYERVGPEHSWNSSQRLSNWLTFNLQRHSHHHAHVTRHYEELEHAAGAPQLPAGYGAMILVALVPPLWRKVMDPRLAAWQARYGGAT